MTLVSPTQSNPGDELTDTLLNTPHNQIADVLNGNIDDTNVSSLSGTKISSGTIPAAAMTTDSNPETRFDEAFPDFIASGCVWSATTGLGGAMTSGIVYINGKRVVVSSIAAHTFTASKDTYISVDSTGTVTYSETTNGGTAPSLPSNSIWVYIGISGASSISGFDDIGIRQPTGLIIARRKLSAAGDSIDVQNIPAKSYLTVRVRALESGSIRAIVRFNNDTSSNYSYRTSTNGAADSTGTSTSAMIFSASGASPKYMEFTIDNIATKEKFVKGIEAEATTGAGTAPGRLEIWGKWANTSAQVTRITIANDQAGDFAASSEVIVYGHD